MALPINIYLIRGYVDCVHKSFINLYKNGKKKHKIVCCMYSVSPIILLNAELPAPVVLLLTK